MSKKILLLTVSLCLAATAAFAEMGVGVKAGTMRNSTPLILLPTSWNYNGSYDDDWSLYGGEIFYESDAVHRWGVKTGYEWIPTSTYKQTSLGSEEKYTYKTAVIPLTAYYKYAPESSSWNVWGGGGLNYMKVTYTSLASASDYTQTKIVPHLDAGAEWRFLKHFGLGLNFGYLFGANFDKLQNSDGTTALVYDTPANSAMNVDHTGLRADLGLRYYF